MTRKLKWWQKKKEEDALRAAILGALAAFLFLGWLVAVLPEVGSQTSEVGPLDDPSGLTSGAAIMSGSVNFVPPDLVIGAPGGGVIVIHQDKGQVEFRDCNLDPAVWKFWHDVVQGETR